MNSEKRFPINLDSVAGLLTGFLLLSIAVVIGLGSQIGIRVTTELPVDDIIGPFETITLHFSEPIDGALAIKNFSIQPVVDGSFKLSDPKTLQFVPRQPFQLDTAYTLTLASGSVNQNGGFLKKSRSWNFRVRAPLIVYLVTGNNKSQLWSVEPDTGKTNPLTDDSFKIFDFDTSHSGEFVVFSAFNEKNGSDLWRVDRAGGTPVLLIQCGADRCSVPAISFYDQSVAYVRESAAPTSDLSYGSPRIWVLNLDTKRDALLYEDQQIIGYGPVWSPDGTRLSSYDGFKDEIRLLDLVTGNQFTIPSQTGSPVTWSNDGDIFVFTDVATNDIGTFTRIREANLSTQETTTMFGEKDERDYRYNALAWSPTEKKLVIGLQFDANDPAQALWLIDPVTQGGQVIANQPDYIYNNPKWIALRKALVFQQFRLKGNYKPEIGLWRSGWQEPRLLVEGLLPHWLP